MVYRVFDKNSWTIHIKAPQHDRLHGGASMGWIRHLVSDVSCSQCSFRVENSELHTYRTSLLNIRDWNMSVPKLATANDTAAVGHWRPSTKLVGFTKNAVILLDLRMILWPESRSSNRWGNSSLDWIPNLNTCVVSRIVVGIRALTQLGGGIDIEHDEN